MTWLGDATISECGRYRYALERRMPDVAAPRRVTWVMLNPSTADAAVDDPTIRKVIGFSSRWRFQRITVVNLFAFRATDPRELRVMSRDEAIGPENGAHLREATDNAELVVVAWGTHGKLHHRGRKVGEELAARGIPMWALAVTQRGQPAHPLMLSYELGPAILWTQKWIRP